MSINRSKPLEIPQINLPRCNFPPNRGLRYFVHPYAQIKTEHLEEAQFYFSETSEELKTINEIINDIISHRGTTLPQFYRNKMLDSLRIEMICGNLCSSAYLNFLWYWTYFKYPLTETAYNKILFYFDVNVDILLNEEKKELLEIYSRIKERLYPVVQYMHP